LTLAAFAVKLRVMKLSHWNFLKSLSPRRRKLVLWILGLFLFYTVVGFLILPPIIRSVAVKQLSQQLGREVTIEKVKLNPFALSATVRGLLIKDADGQPFVSWDEVYVNFELVTIFNGALTFKEVSTSRPFVRVQMNRDGSFNFTDIIAKFSTTNAPAKPAAPSAPPVVRIGRLHIGGATAAYSDLTTRVPFKRVLGPLDITLDDFRTDPANKNPYAFSGTTDAGERISWSGHFYLTPLRSQGSLTLDKFTLNKYSPLYENFFRFQIRDGSIGLHLNYRFELGATNRVLQVSDTAFALRDFKLGLPGQTENIVELPHFGVTEVSADLQKRTASVGSIVAADASLLLQRDRNQSVNVVELAKPAESATNAPGGIVFLLRSVTNAVSLLLQSTNQWSGTIRTVDITNCAVHLEDLVNSRPARLDLTEIRFAAKNISNLPETNLTAEFSLRWNTNGSIRTVTTASLLPPTADVQLDLDQIDFGTLDPYLEPKLNLFILGSKLGLHGKISLRTPANDLPQVTFHGNASLDDFKTVDGVMAEDLLKWDALRFNDIDANLNPQTVSVREILIDGAYARLVIETNKSINLLNALKPANPAATNTAAPVVAKETGATNVPLPKVSIGAIVITNTAFSFSDRSMTPDVNMAIREVNGSVAGISTEEMQHAIVDLNAKVDGVGPVAITGIINPLNGAATNSIKISVKDVDLTPASPYAGKFAGYKIARGKLNLDLAYDLVGKNLSSKNVIMLDRFTFGEKVASPDATKLPVRLAIAILKDREGKIVLDVPVEGRTDDPKFRISKVVWGALENILVKVATSPFSLLGAAFGGGEELAYQDFAPGSAMLTDDGKKKLDSLAKALYDHPALELEIAGSIDRDADREGLQRAAIDKEIRRQLWMKLRKSQQATNSVEQMIIPAEDRASWVAKLFAAAQANGKITAQLIAANTNLASLAAQVLPRRAADPHGAALLSQPATPTDPAKKTATAYQSKLNPPPSPQEAVLMATFPAGENEFQALATARVNAVRDYLLNVGKVEAGRLFPTSALRTDGSRAYLQFQ
jgi:hypothetical protein